MAAYLAIVCSKNVEDPPLSELLKKNETIAQGVQRYRNQLEGSATELQRVLPAPRHSSVVKEAAKGQLARLAKAGAPNCARAIAHGSPIGFPMQTISSLVRSVEPTLTF